MSRMNGGLLLLNLLVILLIVTIHFFPSLTVQIILGLPFILFFPGYVLLAALFPQKGRLESNERIMLSLGMSIAVVPLIAMILNFTPWGITIATTLYSLALYIFIVSVIAWFRNSKLPEDERFGNKLQLPKLSWGESPLDKVISISGALSILVMLGVLGYFIAAPKTENNFTEFYILGQEGKAIDYPDEIKLGEKVTVIAGIVNYEHETVDYQIIVIINGAYSKATGLISLEHLQKWEDTISFMPGDIGNNQRLEFLLIRTPDSEPYLEPLHLWINVVP